MPQLQRHESEESLLDACDFETHSFVDSTVGSRILDQSFVSVKDGPSPSHGSKENTARPAARKKMPMGAKEKEKPLIK